MRAEPLCAERRSPRHAKSAFVTAFFALLLVPRPGGATSITDSAGTVFFLKSGTHRWIQAARGQAVNKGDQVRLAMGARATLTFDDASRVELSPGSSFTLKDDDPQASEVSLTLGSLRAWVTKRRDRRFQVRTPTAVAAVRGTEFSVDVAAEGVTRVQMFNGLLAVSDNKGNEVLIKDTQSVEVTAQGIGQVAGAARGGERDPRSAREIARREVGLEMTKEEVQAAAALEQKNAVYQEGKALIDVNGMRVRVEEYIVRPDPNQFKLVVLNERTDRFDYFYYKGTFFQTLPDDLSIALRQLPGCIGSQCQYWLTGYETARSNTQDNMLEITSGGHQIDVNNTGQGLNADGNPYDAVTAAYDPATDQFTNLTLGAPGVNNPALNQPFFQTVFDNYRLTFNGVEHGSWSPFGAATITTTRPSVAGGLAYLDTTVVQYPADGCAPPNCTYTEEGVLHQVVYAENVGGTIWEKYDNYIISDEGKIAGLADFAGVTSGSSYKSALLNWNYQQIVTASEFGGRKIDLVVEPKIFIKSGLIP